MYRIPNKNPLDLQNRKIIGFKFPFNAKAVFNLTYNTTDQIKANLINYFMTNKGERVFNPYFGADLKKKIFEPLTINNSELLKKQIQEEIKPLFPQVKINNIDIINDYDNNTMNIIFNYSVLEIEDSIKIEIS